MTPTPHGTTHPRPTTNDHEPQRLVVAGGGRREGTHQLNTTISVTEWAERPLDGALTTPPQGHGCGTALRGVHTPHYPSCASVLRAVPLRKEVADG